MSRAPVRALADEQRPRPTDAARMLLIECRAVGVLAVSIAGVTPPRRPRRQLAAQHRVDGAYGIQDPGIVRGAEAEAHERERIG
jgi:hypothetical protein